MSFDLAVWAWSRPLSLAEAEELHGRMCEGEPIEEADSPAIEAFYDELTKRFPDPDMCSEEEIAHSPWSCGFDRSNWFILMCIRWSRAGEVAEVVQQLARKHGLYCYDAQVPTLHVPPDAPDLRRKGDRGGMFAWLKSWL